MSDVDPESELQRSSRDFLGALAALEVMEREKQEMAPDDPARVGLAIDIEELTLGLLGRSQYQTRLAAQSQQEAAPEPRPVHIVLRDWRDAERRLREAALAVRRIALESTGFEEEYRRSVARVEQRQGDAASLA